MRRNRWKIYASFLFFIFSCGVPLFAFAATSTKAFTYTRLFYYQDGAQARKSFLTHPSSIDIFAPQAYGINDHGQVFGSLDPTLLRFAHAHKIKVMPLVINSNFDSTSYQAILDNPSIQVAAIQALVLEATQQGYWGWQIDFEQLDASYKDKFSAFIKNASVAMHQHGLTLSVAVVSKVSDNPNDYPHNLWQKLVGVFDYASLASSSDFVSVMSYDDPNSTGPIVENMWLQKVLTYSLQFIPRQKLSLGIPFYYWQWSDATGKRVGIGGNVGIQNVLRNHQVTLHYSTTEQAPYIHYYSHGHGFTIWYENAKSIAQKVALIQKNKLYGFSGWALGLELSSVYGSL